MKMLLGGAWVDRPGRIEVRNPFKSSVIDTVPQSTAADVDEALASAEHEQCVCSLDISGTRYFARWPI